MSEQTKSAPLETETALVVPGVALGGVGTALVHPWSGWLKRLLACNPFYLVSAALLLFGINRVSLDPHFLRTELAQLTFNFTSLQLYELLLVGTAIVLARRAVWYDSTLLLVLENLLVLVPFMLVSQAAFMQPGMVWTFCVLAVVLVVGRTGAARRFLAGFSPSPRLLTIGLAVLTANAALPVIYRHLHESKVGTRPTCGAAFEMNEAGWLWLLPILCALTSLLPHPRNDGKLPVQRRWFPVTLCLLWMLATGVHLFSLGYVYDFTLRGELVAPAVWVLAWELHLRLTDFIAAPAAALRVAVLCGPLLATLLAFGVPGSHVFITLTVMNVFGFAGVALFDRENRAARRLLLITLAALVAALPQTQGAAVLAEVGPPAGWLALASAAYLVLCATVSRNPKLGIAGALATAALAGLWREPNPDAFLWAMQAGFVFYLLHSLRWRDYEHAGAATVRVVIAAAWVLHSLIWIRATGALWQPLAIAAGVLALCGLQGWIRRKRPPIAVPAAATTVALLVPANLAVVQLQTTPVGVAAVVGSFVLFGFGTVLALTKPRWNRAHGTSGLP